jgi:transcription antitermination factor NusG
MKTKLARRMAKAKAKKPQHWIAEYLEKHHGREPKTPPKTEWRDVDETSPLLPAPLASRWVVLMVEPRMEIKAATALREAGYVAWFPQTVEVVKSEKRKLRRRVNRPLFARYLFAAHRGRVGMADCDHVSAIIGEVPQALIDNLSARQGLGEFEATDPARTFGKGSRVRITDGPFSGLEGIVDLAAKDRVDVLMRIFGREQPVRFEAGQVEAA